MVSSDIAVARSLIAEALRANTRSQTSSAPPLAAPPPLRPSAVEADPLVLGYLRPNDVFAFAGVAPEDVDPDGVYHVYPANRGYVSFGASETAQRAVHLRKALEYPVRLAGDLMRQPDKLTRFYPGDRVRSRKHSVCGTVVVSTTEEALVRFDDKPAEPESVALRDLKLVDKDKTTRSYVQPLNGKWVISVGETSLEEDTQLDAVKALRGADGLRFAFNRWSRLASMTPDDLGFDLELRTVDYLRNVDGQFWNTPRLRRRFPRQASA